MAAVLTRDKLLLVKVETTNGTDITPAVADAISVEGDAEPVVETAYGERKIITGSYVPGHSIALGSKITIPVSVRLRGSGVAATAPKWARLLQAAGFKAALDTDHQDITPDPEDQKTLSAYLYRGGHLFKALGCAFEADALAYDGGWKLNGNLRGVLGAAPTAVATPASPVFDSGTYLSGLGCACTYDGSSVVLRSLSIAFGQEIAEIANLNAAQGISHYLSAGFTPKIKMKIDDVPIGTKDWRAYAYLSQPADAEILTLTVGAVEGSIFSVTCPNCRLTNCVEGSEGGVGTLEFDVEPTDSEAQGHDWITITTR